MEKIEGGITSPKGFRATGAAIGIKKGVKDLALLASDMPATAAAAFTTNVVKAASVLRNMEIMSQKGFINGVAINSGNANACTGPDGVLANQEMAEAFASYLNVEPNTILTASTGVIGAPFPIEIVKKGIQDTAPSLGTSRKDALLAATSIMTTDTYCKEICFKSIIGGAEVHMAGMAKGSGMIHPNMATMLSFLTTDIAISAELLEKALKEDIKSTYNMVSVDGDTSTNDTVVVLANGLAGNCEIVTEGKDYEEFKAMLHAANEQLSKDLVRDGEGATKFVEIKVNGMDSYENAKIIAKSVVTSSLVKTAMFGEDANWGRVLCAMGYSGVLFDPQKVDITYCSKKGSIDLMEDGKPIVFDEEKAKQILSEKEITVEITLKEGNQSAVAWGCDFSYDYVKINGDYRS